MVAIAVLEGFCIELNQVTFAGAPGDASFSAAHPMTGIFLMIVVSLALVLADFYGVTGQLRRVVTAVGAIGLVAAAAGTTLWTFADPSHTGPVFALYIAGIVISYVTVLVAAFAVRSAPRQALDRAAA